jgi:predicted hydrocarbon binding protein
VDTKLKDVNIKDGAKYPNAMLMEVITWISRTYGMEYVRKAGRHTVKNLGLLAYVVRFASIETMLGKAKDAYNEAYFFGDVEMNISVNRAVATMKDVSELPENCEGWIGALEALLEITRTKGTVKKTKCQLKGDECCEYEIDWS